MIRVFIVHPENAHCAKMTSVLQGEPDMQVIGSAPTVRDANAIMQRHPGDVVLVSALLPDDGAFEIIRHLCAQEQPAKILVTDLTKTTEIILNAMEEGAAGYVCLEESAAELVKKIRSVYEDEFLVCPDIATALMARVAELKQLVHELDCMAFVESAALAVELTPREQEVLELIGQGMSNREIADTLIVELGTVKNHVHNLLRKLDVSNRDQAAQFATQILGRMAETA